MAEAHAIEAREVRGAFRRRHHVVRGHGQRQVRQAHFAQLRAELLVHRERLANALLVLRVEALVEELLQQADAQTLQRLRSAPAA